MSFYKWEFQWYRVRVRVMVFNVTFNNISVISLRPRSTRWKPPTCRKSLTNFILYCSLLYRVHLTWLGFELKTLVQSLPRVVGPYILSNVVQLWWRIQFICKACIAKRESLKISNGYLKSVMRRRISYNSQIKTTKILTMID